KRMLDTAKSDGEVGPILFVRTYCFAREYAARADGFIMTEEPRPAIPANAVLAPVWLPERYHERYDAFLNRSVHDLNLLRYLTGNELRVSATALGHAKAGAVIFDCGDHSAVYEFGESSLSQWHEGVEV